MRTRIQVSTDVAALGIWDRGEPTAVAERNVTTLEALARQGEACIVRMGGDCGGAVDVFVNEDIPAELVAESTPISEERTVVIRSGEVVIDGVEYFGTAKRMSSETASVCRLPNGVYRTRIRLTKDEDKLPEPASEKEIRRIVGSGEVDYYDKTNRNGLLLGLTTLLILPALLFVMPWFVAVPITLGVFISYFHVQEWILRRNPRFQKAAEKIVPLRLAHERPLLAVQFSKWDGALLGGSSMTFEPLPKEKL